MEKYEKAEQDYMAGMKYKDIAEKYKTTINTVKSWKKRYGWNRAEGAHKEEKVCTQKEKSVQLDYNITGSMEKQQAEIQLLKAKAQPEDIEEMADDGFIDALNSAASEDWQDEED